MYILMFIYGWFYYGFYYFIGGVFATYSLNFLVKKLWLTPLIINAISIVIFLIMVYNNMIAQLDRAYVLYFNYMPIVGGSVFTNFVIWIYRKISSK